MIFAPIITGLLASLNLALLVAYPSAQNAGLFAVTVVCFIVTLANHLRWGGR
jgi:hypothetical protein